MLMPELRRKPLMSPPSSSQIYEQVGQVARNRRTCRYSNVSRWRSATFTPFIGLS